MDELYVLARRVREKQAHDRSSEEDDLFPKWSESHRLQFREFPFRELQCRRSLSSLAASSRSRARPPRMASTSASTS